MNISQEKKAIVEELKQIEAYSRAARRYFKTGDMEAFNSAMNTIKAKAHSVDCIQAGIELAERGRA